MNITEEMDFKPQTKMTPEEFEDYQGCFAVIFVIVTMLIILFL